MASKVAMERGIAAAFQYQRDLPGVGQEARFGDALLQGDGIGLRRYDRVYQTGDILETGQERRARCRDRR